MNTKDNNGLERVGECKRDRIMRLIRQYEKNNISYNIEELINLSRKDIQRLQYAIKPKTIHRDMRTN